MAGGKVLEYSIAVFHIGQLMPVAMAGINADDLAGIYRRMCDFYLEEKIKPNEKYYRRYRS